MAIVLTGDVELKRIIELLTKSNLTGGDFANYFIAIDGVNDSDTKNISLALLKTVFGSTFSDADFQIFNNSDNTKKIDFLLSGLTTATLRTLTIQDKDGTLALLANQISIASDATPNPSGDSKENEYYLTALAVAATFAAPSGTPVNGNNLLIRIEDNGTARALAFNVIYEAVGVTLPTTTVLGKKMYIGCIYNSADSKWDVVSVINEA